MTVVCRQGGWGVAGGSPGTHTFALMWLQVSGGEGASPGNPWQGIKEKERLL